MQSISGILDKACTQTVVGEDWLRDFEEFIHWPLQYLKNDTKFKGIGGVVTSSERMVRRSCLVFVKQMTLEASLIPGNTPLLISKTSMAKLGIVLDTARNRVRVQSLDGPHGKWRDVPVALSGHLLLPIDDLFLERDGKVDEAMVVASVKPPAWRIKRAIMEAMTNLHKLF